MSAKEKLLQLKQHLDEEKYAEGMAVCESLLQSSTPSLPPAQFNLISAYGLCALRCSQLSIAEDYCTQADAIEVPAAQSQKNLKVYLELIAQYNCI